MSLQGLLLKAGSPGKCSQRWFFFGCSCNAVLTCIQLILVHLEILAGFIGRSSEVIATFSSIFLCLSLSTVFGGHRSISMLITSILVV